MTHSYKDLYSRLPQFKSHKVVAAMQITAIGPGNDITLGDKQHKLKAFSDWMTKHEPKVGGYLVVYEDGYLSFSPAEAFEGGYTRLETPGNTTFIDRLNAEKDDVSTRLAKLLGFIASDAFAELSHEHQGLLIDQRDAMVLYEEALESRLHLLGDIA